MTLTEARAIYTRASDNLADGLPVNWAELDRAERVIDEHNAKGDQA